MKFSELFKSDSPVFRVPGFPETLFPEDVPEEMQKHIKLEFYDYDIAISPPWVWVERFHYLIKRHLYQWQKLIASEQALRDEDAIYNYDLTENSTLATHMTESANATGVTTDFVSDTPDGSLTDIDSYMSAGTKGQSVSNTANVGDTQNAGTLRRYGNIGITTAARILGGYRTAMDYDAYKTIFDELSILFMGSFDLEDNGEYVETVNPWNQ